MIYDSQLNKYLEHEHEQYLTAEDVYDLATDSDLNTLEQKVSASLGQLYSNSQADKNQLLGKIGELNKLFELVNNNVNGSAETLKTILKANLSKVSNDLSVEILKLSKDVSKIKLGAENDEGTFLEPNNTLIIDEGYF